MRSLSAPPRTSRAGRPAPRRGAGRGRRGAHHAFLCLIPQSSRIFSYVAALARLPRPALPVFERFLVKCLKFNLKVTLYHVSNILTHRSGLRSSTHPFRVRGSFKSLRKTQSLSAYPCFLREIRKVYLRTLVSPEKSGPVYLRTLIFLEKKACLDG